MSPVEPIGGGTAPSQIYGASSRQRCGNDGQRKRVAHMPTATTTKEDSRSKLVQNHPHDFTKKQNGFAIDAVSGNVGDIIIVADRADPPAQRFNHVKKHRVVDVLGLVAQLFLKV